MISYRKRIADKILEDKLETFGAVLIDGPKACGKTTTAKQKARTVVEFRDGDRREALLATADAMPSKLLKGDRPVLLDEWQDAPKVWGAVKKSVDDEGGKGMYILTGSSSRFVETPHTGTGRISTMTMLPLSLYESGESDGSVSLKALFDSPGSYDGCTSSLTVDDLIFAICRGGWPEAVFDTKRERQLDIAKDLFRQAYAADVSRIDGVRRSPDTAKAVLRSYARNVCTMAKSVTGDVCESCGATENTVHDYVGAFKKLYVIEDIPAWGSDIKSKTAMRSSRKKNFVDPSLAVAALGVGPAYFDRDFKTLGFLFECLCMRDLKAYSTPSYGEVSYYRDRDGLEADCILRLDDGRYALVEFKMGASEIEKGAEHLNRIEGLIGRRNELSPDEPLIPPTLKMVVTGTQYGYRREDGVLVVPIGCLRD